MKYIKFNSFRYFLFIFVVLICGSFQLNGQQIDYDSIDQQSLKNPRPESERALLKIKILNTKQAPMRGIPVYLVDEKNTVVYFRKTNLKGVANFLVPVDKHYDIDIHKNKQYSNVNVSDHSYMTQNLTITFDPRWNNKPKKQPPDVIPGDTIYQTHTAEKRPSKTHGNIIMKLIDKESRPVTNTDVYLKDVEKKICYAATTNHKGQAFFFVENNKTYWLSFNDFQNHSEVELPDIAYLNLTQEVYYSPPRVTETNSNDTILQEFDGKAKVATSRALVTVYVRNLSKEPIEGYPVIVDKLKSDTVYLSYTNHEGISYFLLPKGAEYKLLFFKDDFHENLYFPKTSGFRTSEVTYETSGLLIDKETYEKVEMATPMASYVYENLPKVKSLEEYCPPIGDQGRYGTCVGWATAYYAYTIVNAMNTENTTPESDEEIFSPAWIYEQIKFDIDNECSMGTYIESAFDLMKNTGNLSISDIPYACGTDITASHKQKAGNYKIIEYRRLFNWDADEDMIINSVKKSLSENHPVVIGFKVPASFHVAGEWWEPGPGDFSSIFGGNHAMTVVGYDDGRKSGAFRIINSWGEDWGDKGYIWVEYDDFAEYCFSAFEFFTSTSGDDLQADIKIKNDQSTVIDNLKLIKKDGYIPGYHCNEKIISGAIEFNVKGNGYFNIYGISDKNIIKRIFPSDHSKTSSFMGYSENAVHLNIRDFSDFKELIFVFSKSSINLENEVNQLNKKLKITNDLIYHKLKNRLHKNFRLEDGKISFSTETLGKGKLVVFGVKLIRN